MCLCAAVKCERGGDRTLGMCHLACGLCKMPSLTGKRLPDYRPRQPSLRTLRSRQHSNTTAFTSLCDAQDTGMTKSLLSGFGVLSNTWESTSMLLTVCDTRAGACSVLAANSAHSIRHATKPPLMRRTLQCGCLHQCRWHSNANLADQLGSAIQTTGITLF